MPKKNLEELLALTDHVVVGVIERVDMLSGDGHEVTDLNAMNGHKGNHIRLHIKVSEYIESNAEKKPSHLVVEIWKASIVSLGYMQKGVGEKVIFLLKGKEFSRAYDSYFTRNPSERDEIERILNNKPNKSLKKDANKNNSAF